MQINQWQKWVLLAGVWLLTACTTLPPGIDSDDEQLVTDYQQWTAMMPQSGQAVRLGGVIAQIKNLSDQTRIEVVNLPIDKQGKPLISREPQGRFVVYLDGFVDPLTHGEGRLMTFLGRSIGSEVSKVGEFEYTFPVMRAEGFHLWRIEERVIIDDITPYAFPCRNFYCRHIEDLPRSGRVIQEIK